MMAKATRKAASSDSIWCDPGQPRPASPRVAGAPDLSPGRAAASCALSELLPPPRTGSCKFYIFETNLRGSC